MSATLNMFAAALGDATELSKAHELVHSTANCGSLEPRWWVVDIGVRARVLDTLAAAVPLPGPAEFRGSDFGDHAPFHFLIAAGVLDGRMGSNRRWLIDATSTRTYVFASSVSVHLLGPDSLEPYLVGFEPAPRARLTTFVSVNAGLWPCDTSRQHGIPGTVGRASNCTLRARVRAGETKVAVAIPPGARTLTVYDNTGSSSAWSWLLGTERVGQIPVLHGQSDVSAPVPSCTHVAPASAHPEDRDVLLVFGVDL